MGIPIRVLLVVPPSGGGLEGDFGDPHLVALGSYLRARTGAEVELIDLNYERLLPAPDAERVFRPDVAVVGISCYSSFDYLAAFYLGCEIRRRNPGAVLVAGGYHPSARPGDFLNLPGSPLEEPSPFDHVVVGEGERPMERIGEAAARGERLAEPILGPEPLADLDELPPLDWSLLGRYREVGRQFGGQANLHFSRGCPFRCSFCMERSKGETAWRAWSPARAIEELRRLHAWLGLKGRTLFIADAVFGLDAAWRREMLERLAQLDLGLRAIWALTRIDRVGPGDAERFRRAGFGLGFGLESGDPGMLRLIGKTRDAEGFLARFQSFAAEAAKIGLPWGANVIAGHPGETAASLERSARFVGKLFLGTANLTGFLSVDPFRLYPGSLVDRQLDEYARQFGTRVHRPRWWNYSDQAFTAEWVDPSRALSYRQREALTARLFEPIARGIAERFAYRGPAADYFRRSVERAVELFSPPVRLRTLADYHLWRGLTGQSRARLSHDPEAQALFRRAREETLRRIEAERGITAPPRILRALAAEPRERYVPAGEVLDSWQDTAISLSPLVSPPAAGGSTLSALHAYMLNYALLDLRDGDRLVEVGSGTGYGAALAARLVGPEGRVTTFEIAPALAAQARRNLARRRNVRVRCGDGLRPARLPRFGKALFTCAVRQVPRPYLDALPEGGRLLAPLLAREGGEEQVLTLFTRIHGKLVATLHGPVRYVTA